eukprot:CAMPEP_0185756524 /NCGR_PEP_ID=MMETSP1174-20130828/14945_1 /TAXON_ID=35687 /ORGANISM="Dictyocha speculum, Strain CCMP1381" /LENGTH=421 /DNA_ID=CAMNT_0028435519 /DNA_START=59 /DNA_END=1324 /DNA_ORIENTATION=-
MNTSKIDYVSNAELLLTLSTQQWPNAVINDAHEFSDGEIMDEKNGAHSQIEDRRDSVRTTTQLESLEKSLSDEPLSDELRLIQELDEADALEEAMEEAFEIVEKLRVPVDSALLQRLQLLIVKLVPENMQNEDFIGNVPNLDELLAAYHKKIESNLVTAMAMCDRESTALMLTVVKDLQPISLLPDSLGPIITKAVRLCDRCDGVSAYLAAAIKSRDPKQVASAILVARQIPNFSDSHLTMAEKLFQRTRATPVDNGTAKTTVSKRHARGEHTFTESIQDDAANDKADTSSPEPSVSSGEREVAAQHTDEDASSIHTFSRYDVISYVSDVLSDVGEMKGNDSEGTSYFSVFLNPHTTLSNELSNATESRDKQKIPELLVQAHWLEDASSDPAMEAAKYLQRGKWKDVLGGWLKAKVFFFCN